MDTDWRPPAAERCHRRPPTPRPRLGRVLTLILFRPRLIKLFKKTDQTFGTLRRFSFQQTEAEPDDLALALGIDGDSDYRCHRDDAAAVAHLQIG